MDGERIRTDALKPHRCLLGLGWAGVAAGWLASQGCGSPDPWIPEEPPPLGSSTGGASGAAGKGGAGGAGGGGAACSPDDTTMMYLHVTNNSADPVRVIELAADCHEMEQGVIPPSEAAGFYSYITHIFRFYDATDGHLWKEITIQHDGTTEETVP